MSDTSSTGTIFFFHGADTASSRAKVADVRKTFVERYGETDVDVLEGVDLDSAAELRALAGTRPFFGQKRLIIVRNLSASRSPKVKDEITSALDRYRESPVVLVFHESRGFDKKERQAAFFRRLSSEKYALEFAAPTPMALARRITEALGAEGISVDPHAAVTLGQDLASDPARVPQEIEKLALYKLGDSTPLSAEEVQLLVRPETASNVFALSDALGAKNAAAAAREYSRLLAHGEGGMRLLSMLVSHVRALLVGKDLLEHGSGEQPAAQALASGLRLHPFVAKKAVAQARNFSFAELAQLFHRLKELDVAAKTGKAEVNGGLLDLLVESAGISRAR